MCYKLFVGLHQVIHITALYVGVPAMLSILCLCGLFRLHLLQTLKMICMSSLSCLRIYISNKLYIKQTTDQYFLTMNCSSRQQHVCCCAGHHMTPNRSMPPTFVPISILIYTELFIHFQTQHTIRLYNTICKYIHII